MKQKLLLIIILLGSREAFSTSFPADTTKVASKTANEVNQSKITFANSWGISAGIGTLGYGGTLNKKISNHFSLNLGYYSGNLNQSTKTTFGTDKVAIDANIKIGAAIFLFDYHPFIKSSFRLSFGGAYNFNNYNVDITPSGDQSYGLIKYNSEQVGNITFDIKGANIAPYLGIGFGRSIPKHLVGVGFDMGVFYHGNPQTKLNTTGTFEPSNNAENQATVQKAFEGLNIYPFINLKLNIRIIK